MNSYLIYVPLASTASATTGTMIVVTCFIGMIVLYIRFLQKQPLTRCAPKCDVCKGTGRELHSITPRPCPACNGTGQYDLSRGWPPVSRITIQPPGAIPAPPHRAPATKIPITENWPRLCELCKTNMQSPDDRLEWHGIGSCAPICMPCAGSGKKLPEELQWWSEIAALPENTPTCPACDGRGYETITPAQTEARPYEVRSATIHGVVAPGTLQITKIQSPELNALLEQTTYEHERDIVIRAYRLGRAQATTPLPIASVPSQKPAGENIYFPLQQITSCDVCAVEKELIELNIQCDTCLGRTVTKLVDEWKNGIRSQIQTTPIYKCDVCASTTTANHCDVVCHRDECIQKYAAMNTKDVQ